VAFSGRESGSAPSFGGSEGETSEEVTFELGSGFEGPAGSGSDAQTGPKNNALINTILNPTTLGTMGDIEFSFSAP
jgi:hypothetical protein